MRAQQLKQASILLLSCISTASSAFTLQPLKVEGLPSKTGLDAHKQQQQEHDDNSRRSFFNTIQTTVTGLALGTLASTISPTPAWSTLMDNNMANAKTFKLGEKLSPEEAKKRFKDAMVEIDELIENYSDISKGGGDAVRRYLGTVGVDKKMYGITKVVKELREEADDIVEYTELANEFEAYLYQAEGAAYQSLFVEHSSAKGTPETFLATAKKDVINMRKYMSDLAEQLKL